MWHTVFLLLGFFLFLGNFRSGRTVYIFQAVHVSSVLTGICDCFSAGKGTAHALRCLWVTCAASEDCLLSASSQWAVWFFSFLKYVLDINPVRCIDRKSFLPFYRLPSSCFLCYAELFQSYPTPPANCCYYSLSRKPCL